MNTYTVYRHPKYELFEAVKVGFSWPALLFNFFWMLVKGLWLCAGMYVVAGIALAQLDKVSDTMQSGALDLLTGIAYLAMLLVPGFMGNKWLNSKLIRKGYEGVGTTRAYSPNGAVGQFVEEYVGVFETTDMSEIVVAKSILESADVPYKVTGELLNARGLLAGPARISVPTTENERALQLLRQVEA